jgi:cytoskeletal protein CcmA (bactofilin family)
MLRQIIGTQNEPAAPAQGRGPAAVPPQKHAAPPPAPAPAPARPAASPSFMGGGKNVLSADVEIKGSIKFSHDLILDGKIEGQVQSDGALTVGENAVIKGEIHTRTVAVFGRVEGNVTVQERCELKSTAVLIGDVSAETLSIEEGASFQGKSQVGRRPSAK